MSSFAGVAFRVVGNDGTVRGITKGEDGARRWFGRARFATLADLEAIKDRVSWVEVHRVYGTGGVNVHLQGGYGPAALSVMVGMGETGGGTAVLVSVGDVTASGYAATAFEADLEFIVP